MARFIADFTVNRADADQFIQFVTLDFLQKEGFKYMDYKGEMVWKKGTGALAAPQFMKIEHKNGQVHLEAWLRTVWLPGVHGSEMDLSGAWGFAIKDAFRAKINQLIGLLQQPQMVQDGQAAQQPWQTSAQAQAAPVQQNVPPVQQSGSVPVAVHNTNGSATASLVLGLVSILGLLSPIIGIVCSIIGIGCGVKGRRSGAKGLATAGLVLSIIFLVVSIINAIVGAMLNYYYYMY